MGLVYSEVGGITVATSGSDEQTVGRELKRIDSRYRLSCDQGQDGRFAWSVVCIVGSERPAMPVVSWRDAYDNPLPLSHGLVEKVKRLRADSRWCEPDALALNDELRRKHNDEIGEQLEELAYEGIRRMKRNPSIHRSRGLQAARARARERGEGIV